MKKKVLGVVLSLTMVASLLVGCGNSGNKTASKADSTKATKAEDLNVNAGDSNAASDESKEIAFWNIATESPDKDIMEYAVDKFNKNTKSGYTKNDSDTK